jgi:hypothetical protein
MSILETTTACQPRTKYVRYARQRTARKQRRRLGFMWAIVAVVTLLGAWDAAGRIDAVAYTAPSIH